MLDRANFQQKIMRDHKIIMKILAIETSCDETAISILDCEKDTVNVLAHKINSQIEIHKEFGGVFPSLARREHGLNCVPVLEETLKETKIPSETFLISENLKEELKNILEREPKLFELLIPFLEKTGKPKIDAIAVTEGPGLEPALWVGITFAKALSLAWNLPIISVNHMEGHIVSALLVANSQATSAQTNADYTQTTQTNADLDQEYFSAEKFPDHDSTRQSPSLRSETLPSSPREYPRMTKEYKDDRKLTIQNIEFPAISLLVSGGHTELVKIDAIGSYEVIGRTRDDAVGEAFDKVARILGLPYPGGPQISALAEISRKVADRTPTYAEKNSEFESISIPQLSASGPRLSAGGSTLPPLPRPMLHSHDLDFSFSGLKTAVLYMVQKIPEMTEEIKMQIAKEFEDSVIEVLVSKTKTAIETYGAKTLIVGGGVIANKLLRQTLVDSLPQTKVLIPNMKLTTDNAVMIGVAGYLKINRSNSAYSTDLKAQGGMQLTKN
ncbi:MAG: tRNA (adenosine(37)-N6)-threonylcarbamoyltransferase complex transferase subunit TsaD [bacterium]